MKHLSLFFSLFIFVSACFTSKSNAAPFSKQEMYDKAVEVVGGLADEYNDYIPPELEKVKGVARLPRIATTCPPGITSAPERFEARIHDFGEISNDDGVSIEINGKPATIDQLPPDLKKKILAQQSKYKNAKEDWLLESIRKSQKEKRVLIVTAYNLDKLLKIIGNICSVRKNKFNDVTLVVLTERDDQTALEESAQGKFRMVVSAKVK